MKTPMHVTRTNTVDFPEKIILWDFDGTLGYRDGIWSGPIIQVAEEASPGIGLTREIIHPLLEGVFPWNHPERIHSHIVDADVWWDALYPGLIMLFENVGFPRDAANVLAKDVRKVFCASEGWHLFEDSLPAIDGLSRDGWGHILLSNHVPELPDILDFLGVRSRFIRVWNSAETGFEKPNAEAFLSVLNELPENTTVVMVGDNPVADIAGARAVGIPAVLVRRELPGIEPYCSRLAELPATLEALLN